jgi:hypothetical protein
MTLEEILAAEIERLEKNYGFDYRFILIIRKKKDTFTVNGFQPVSICTSPMTENCRGSMLEAAKRLP